MTTLRDHWANLLRPQSIWLPYAGWLSLILAFTTVNALSVAADLARAHSHTAGWEPYAWEYTSWFGTAAAFLPTWFATARLTTLRVHPAFSALLLIPLSLIYAAVHVGTMVALRIAIYRLAHSHYDFGPPIARAIYEYRKDILAFVLLCFLLLIWRHYPRPTPPADPALPPREPVFLIAEKSGVLPIRASQIDWVEAQGNYVALHVAGRAHLLRQSMKQVEATLADWSFLRTHRSALVNRTRIARVVRTDQGASVELQGGACAPLSESRRGALLRSIEGPG